MILVRPAADSDKPDLNRLADAQGFEYERPDWGGMLVSSVVEVNGEITMGAFLRKTAEVYLVVDPGAGRKRDRLGQLLMLHRELLQPAKRVGFEDCSCWVPPEIDKHFGKLLLHLGWVKPLWPNYVYRFPKENSNG